MCKFSRFFLSGAYLMYKIYNICQKILIIILKKCFIDNALCHTLEVWRTSQSQEGQKFGACL